jgi:hypothetical protein
LNYGSWSVGNPVHLGSALLESMTGTEMQHIIYKETSMLYAGVANGELNFALGSLATAGPLQRSGKIKFIAVTAPKRHPAFPDVPTVAESGGPAGYEVTGWTTIGAPKGLPKAVADKIQKDIEAALAEPDIKERYATFGYETFPATREQFNAYITTESTKYAGRAVSHRQPGRAVPVAWPPRTPTWRRTRSPRQRRDRQPNGPAEACAPSLHTGSYFLDFNSASPGAKSAPPPHRRRRRRAAMSKAR